MVILIIKDNPESLHQSLQKESLELDIRLCSSQMTKEAWLKCLADIRNLRNKNTLLVVVLPPVFLEPNTRDRVGTKHTLPKKTQESKGVMVHREQGSGLGGAVELLRTAQITHPKALRAVSKYLPKPADTKLFLVIAKFFLTWNR
jgi:hypothetical protein